MISNTFIKYDKEKDIVNVDINKTENLFQQYFSNDSMQLVDGKQGQQEKVISISDTVGELIESKQSQLTSNNAGNNITITGSGKDIKINASGGSGDNLWNNTSIDVNLKLAKDINLQGYNLTRVGYPTKEDDASNKRYVDTKQSLLTSDNAGDGINITGSGKDVKISTIEKNKKLQITGSGKDLKISVIEDIIPKWKEVGTKVNINHIKYNFKPNYKYKIYYNFESQISSKKFCFICKEFLYGELNTDIQSLDWDNVNNRIMVSLQLQNNTIYIISNAGKYGQLLKLEELQEQDYVF